jgi:predicted Zn-ribbon and HTH transcriptional regulator
MRRISMLVKIKKMACEDGCRTKLLDAKYRLGRRGELLLVTKRKCSACGTEYISIGVVVP